MPNKDKVREYIKQHEVKVKKDHFEIYIIKVDSIENPVMQELGRLRTESYSKLGQGPEGEELDIDEFDVFYNHIIVWDDEEGEIVGSYRIAKMQDLFDENGRFMSYSTVNFKHSNEFLESEEYLEIARSFIQPKYWSGNFLDHLWFGIGSFLSENPELRYMYGTVSMGRAYSFKAITIIMQYYIKWYDLKNDLIIARYPINFDPKVVDFAKKILSGTNPKEDELILRKTLKEMGHTIPVLLRKYFGISEHGGTRVMRVGEDPSYRSHSLFIRMDTTKLRDIYVKRYLP